MKSVLLNSDFIAPVHILGEVAAKICAECKMVVSGRNSVIFYCFTNNETLLMVTYLETYVSGMVRFF